MVGVRVNELGFRVQGLGLQVGRGLGWSGLGLQDGWG